MDFPAWNRKVYEIVLGLPLRHGKPGAIVDSMIPYRLGWSPERAARALTRLDMADHNILHRAAIESARQPLQETNTCPTPNPTTPCSPI